MPIYSIVTNYRQFKKYNEITHSKEIEDFIDKNINREINSIHDILLKDIAVLIYALPQDKFEDVCFSSMGSDLTTIEAINKLEHYLDMINGNKGFLFSVFY